MQCSIATKDHVNRGDGSIVKIQINQQAFITYVPGDGKTKTKMKLSLQLKDLTLILRIKRLTMN